MQGVNTMTVKDLVTFGRCWPSAAEEEWYSPKRPSSTVAVYNNSELNTKVSAFSLSILRIQSGYETTLPLRQSPAINVLRTTFFHLQLYRNKGLWMWMPLTQFSVIKHLQLFQERTTVNFVDTY